MHGSYTRRVFLRSGVMATVGMMVADQMALATPAPLPAPAPRARSVIQIWMWGGPAHIDTFDPKPQAGYDYCGPLDKPIATNVDGIVIGELLPKLATQADKCCFIRSMSHGVNSHETAAYTVQTGHAAEDRLVFPSIGAVVSYFRGRTGGYNGMIPPYVVLTRTQGRFSESGFLGPLYKPFATGGDPGKERFAVEGIVAEGITDDRQRARRELLENLDTLGHVLPGDAQLDSLDRCRDQAYDMILGDAGKVFDLSKETPEMRERYGRNTFGQSCLMARRLVEIGVPYITINYNGWDTHKEHFQIMRRKLPEMDTGLSALLTDLSERGLLDSTIVWWSGEFGRTPKVQWEAPWNGGRGHYGHVFSAMVAGGGFKGGCVLGKSDERAERVAERPVHPRDLIAGMYELMGIDPQAKLRSPQGETVGLTSDAAGAPSYSRLSEILPTRSAT